MFFSECVAKCITSVHYFWKITALRSEIVKSIYAIGLETFEARYPFSYFWKFLRGFRPKLNMKSAS